MEGMKTWHDLVLILLGLSVGGDAMMTCLLMTVVVGCLTV